MSGTTLREIDDMWQDEGFPVAIDPEPVGQRVTRFQGYLDLVDWTNEGEVARALRVLNVALAGTLLSPSRFPRTWVRQSCASCAGHPLVCDAHCFGPALSQRSLAERQGRWLKPSDPQPDADHTRYRPCPPPKEDTCQVTPRFAPTSALMSTSALGRSLTCPAALSTCRAPLKSAAIDPPLV